MALEVVTDGRNDKTEKNDQEYVHNKRTRDGTCVLFCCVVLPSFVLTDNKCILSCVIIRSKLQPTERKQRRAENETVLGIYVSQFLFHFFSFFFSRLCNQSRDRFGVATLFCVPVSFVLNKYILSCAIIRSPLNESKEELRMKQWCLYLHNSFP